MKKEVSKQTFDKPQYGGTMTLRIDSDIMAFDPNAHVIQLQLNVRLAGMPAHR